MDEIRWGVVGPGRIARLVAADLVHVPHTRLAAVASRSTERAQAFARDLGAERAHTGYRAIVEDPDVDVLYIATPHPQHHAVALAAIEAGKAVLVEKAFTATVAGAEEVVAAARRRGVFAMEAMWTRFQPAVVRARELVAAGAVGEVRLVQADLGVDKPFDAEDRLFAPELGGGTMLDLGVYVVSFAQHFLGVPDRIEVVGSLAPTGVDLEAAMLLGYADGRAATLLASLRQPSPGSARLIGTEGVIDLPPRFHHPHSLTLTRRGEEPEVVEAPPVGGGYSHELVEVTECLRAGRTESQVMPLEDTLAVQRILNAVCEELGVHHQEDTGVDV